MNRAISLCVILLAAAIGFHGGEQQASAQPSPSASDAAHIQWIVDSLKTMQTIKEGMTRGHLAKVFRTEGGISTRRQRRYVFRECPYIKVLVEFEPVDDQDQVEKSEDRIAKISQPFLEW